MVKKEKEIIEVVTVTGADDSIQPKELIPSKKGSGAFLIVSMPGISKIEVKKTLKRGQEPF